MNINLEVSFYNHFNRTYCLSKRFSTSEFVFQYFTIVKVFSKVKKVSKTIRKLDSCQLDFN